jgi:hypothetical protein
VDNIKLDHRQIGRKGVGLIRVAQWRTPVNTVMNLRVAQNAGNSFNSCRITSFPRSIHCVEVAIGNRPDFLCAAGYSIRPGVIMVTIIIIIIIITVRIVSVTNLSSCYLFPIYQTPIRMAGRSKARNYFARSNTGIVGSNPTRQIDVRLRFSCVYVVLCRLIPHPRSRTDCL